MEYLEDLGKSFESLKGELREEMSKIRTNRPTPKLIEDVEVSYIGQKLPVKQLGTISVEVPRNLVVAPWDKESINGIAQAIEEAKMGFSVAVQGNVVRVTLPQLTDERREELSRVVRNTAEQIRIKMRIARDEVNKKVNQEADEDIKFKSKEKLQKLVDEFNKSIDEIVEVKLSEISQ